MSLPVPDSPPPDEQDVVSANAGFAPSPSGASLCGFAIPPLFFFNISFRIPFPNFDFPPTFYFGLSLNCDLSNPIDAEIGIGGGRASTQDPDPFQKDT